MDALGHFGGGGALQARAQLALDNSSQSIEPRPNESVADASQRFESLLATMLVKELRQTLPDGFFGDGPGADVYAGWMDKHLGDALAGSDALGIAGMVKAEIGRIVDAQSAEDTGANL